MLNSSILILLVFIINSFSNCKIITAVPNLIPEEAYFNSIHKLSDALNTLNEESSINYGRENFFILHNRQHPIEGQRLVAGDLFSLRNSIFDPTKQTKILIHGWIDDSNSYFSNLLKDAFLEAGDYNVILVDWSDSANTEGGVAQTRVASLGLNVAAFMFSLTRQGASYDDFHIVGYSLGALIAAHAGDLTDGKLRRFTACDPPVLDIEEKISSTNAQYVEVIHTTEDETTGKVPLGDVDFYPNGGHDMPGCSTYLCNHERAFEYLAASVKYNHLIGQKCDRWEDVIEFTCNGTEMLHLGTSIINKTGSGIYFLETGPEYPF